MLEKWERCLSHAIGVRGVHINSALVSAQNRNRIYWSNIRVKDTGNRSLFDFSDDPFEWPTIKTDIPQPVDKEIVISDILQDDADSRYYLRDDTTMQLLEVSDEKKFKEYFLEPQMSIEEVLAYMDTDPDYVRMPIEERLELAKYGYELEINRLNNNYYGKEGDLYGE